MQPLNPTKNSDAAFCRFLHHYWRRNTALRSYLMQLLLLVTPPNFCCNGCMRSLKLRLRKPPVCVCFIPGQTSRTALVLQNEPQWWEINVNEQTDSLSRRKRVSSPPVQERGISVRIVSNPALMSIRNRGMTFHLLTFCFISAAVMSFRLM